MIVVILLHVIFVVCMLGGDVCHLRLGLIGVCVCVRFDWFKGNNAQRDGSVTFVNYSPTMVV